MTGGQIAALIFAILLLLPGGCFLIFGISLLNDPQVSDAAAPALIVGIAILSVMGLLFWVAFRQRPPSPGAGTTSP
jgi:membrane protein implicated in regulation of membrane protease activity